MAGAAGAVLEAMVGIGSSVVQMGQAEFHNKAATDQSARLHARAIEQAAQFHHESISLDLESARKEGSRDQWGQKSAAAQTLMIVSTLMFACAFGIIVEGMPPDAVGEPVLVFFSATLAGSVSCLFASIFLSIALQRILSAYRTSHPAKVYTPCNEIHPSLMHFYKCHCARVDKHSRVTFYVGTACLVSNAATLVITRLELEFMSHAAGMVYTAVTAGGVLMLLWLVWTHGGSVVRKREYRGGDGSLWSMLCLSGKRDKVIEQVELDQALGLRADTEERDAYTKFTHVTGVGRFRERVDRPHLDDGDGHLRYPPRDDGASLPPDAGSLDGRGGGAGDSPRTLRTEDDDSEAGRNGHADAATASDEGSGLYGVSTQHALSLAEELDLGEDILANRDSDMYHYTYKLKVDRRMKPEVPPPSWLPRHQRRLLEQGHRVARMEQRRAMKAGARR